MSGVFKISGDVSAACGVPIWEAAPHISSELSIVVAIFCGDFEDCVGWGKGRTFPRMHTGQMRSPPTLESAWGGLVQIPFRAERSEAFDLLN